MAGWIDASVPVRDGMVHWPDDPPVEISRAMSIAAGDAANLTRLAMSAHTGTHMDAPRHFVDDGETIEAMPLEVGIGPARVIEIADPRAVTEDELRERGIEGAERLLLRTRNSDRAWWEEPFDAGFVHIEPAAAELIAAAGVRLVGIDYLSVGGEQGGAETHRALLGAGAWIVEGLDLSRAGAGEYELLCLPAKLAGSDGAPARVLLRPAGEEAKQRRKR
jgi:arylformamidase